MEDQLKQLNQNLEGTLEWDSLHKTLFAPDASVYKMQPTAVAYPTSKQDIQTLLLFAQEHKTRLIPRAAGTSFAGQCVGVGIVVDVSKHFTQILNFDVDH